jgi:hypothetical protein
MRTTLAQLEALTAELNKLLNRPLKSWEKENGKLTAQLGNFHLYRAYGAYGLHEMVNENGGVRETIGLGTKRELYTALHKLIQGVELATA